MYLRDLINKNENLNLKIKEIVKILKRDPDNDIATRLIELIDERQRNLIDINSANSQCKLKIGKQEISLNAAVIIRDTMKLKVDVLTELIASDECALDKLALISQRDTLFEDFSLLSMSIINMDINTNVG